MQVLVQSQEKGWEQGEYWGFDMRGLYCLGDLNWEWESIAFHDIMISVKCLPVGTYQYFPILDDPHLKMS